MRVAGKAPIERQAPAACAKIHEALSALPVLHLPRDVPFGDGLYFFYEQGETSPHGPQGRIVRVGNHPRTQGGLVQRLRNHYSGGKNGSVFRKSLGGALLRQRDPSSTCLNHWEKQDAPVCERCRPVEREVSALLRERFSFRCVHIVSMSERNLQEAMLVATLASCRICAPSPAWLGLQACSEEVRSSGLWNSQYVDGRTLDVANLERFLARVRSSRGPFPANA